MHDPFDYYPDLMLESVSEAEKEKYGGCDHGVTFDYDDFLKEENMPAYEVRKRWPRLGGRCPKDCGFAGIAYASMLHYLAGDW